jgi:Clp amino terminal domain, pathogenicity island component
MVKNFSKRARLVLFAARVKAGERGANMLEMDDFLIALVLEDQGLEKSDVPKLLGVRGAFHFEAPLHASFFVPGLAHEIVGSLETALPKSQPISRSAEMRVSPALEQIFEAAVGLQTQLQHSEVRPLHLLAAILTKGSSQGVKLLQAAGVHAEVVLQKLRVDSTPE